jgi:hypothetical protein
MEVIRFIQDLKWLWILLTFVQEFKCSVFTGYRQKVLINLRQFEFFHPRLF